MRLYKRVAKNRVIVQFREHIKSTKGGTKGTHGRSKALTIEDANCDELYNVVKNFLLFWEGYGIGLTFEDFKSAIMLNEKKKS